MKYLIAVVAGALTLSSASALANADLAKAKNCLACHSVERKVVGPAFKEIAAKYAGDKTAAGKLAKKIREGGAGVWGQIPMPANPQVSEEEAKTLASWALSAK